MINSIHYYIIRNIKTINFRSCGIANFVSRGAVIKYSGSQANKVLPYAVASVSGTILAVCSCTVLPLFAGKSWVALLVGGNNLRSSPSSSQSGQRSFTDRMNFRSLVVRSEWIRLSVLLILPGYRTATLSYILDLRNAYLIFCIIFSVLDDYPLPATKVNIVQIQIDEPW